MGEFTRDEIEAAWAEYQKRGVQEHDWPGWAEMFTDDARYEEHNLGVFEGRSAIQRFIVDIMKEYPAMTLWIEWSIIDGDRIGFYIWNNLPDPTGTGKRYGFPNTTFLQYGGDGKFSFEADYYNPADAERVFTEWLTDGGRRDTPQDRSLRGIDGWNPEPPRPAHPRRRSRPSSRSTASGPRSPWRPATGTSGPTSSPTTPSTASTTTATSAAGPRSGRGSSR